MEELTADEKLLIAWAIGFVRSEMKDEADIYTANAILRKLRT